MRTRAFVGFALGFSPRPAAKVERATPEAEGWCVIIDRLGDTEGAVSLELADATAEEAARGMELLKGLVG